MINLEHRLSGLQKMWLTTLVVLALQPSIVQSQSQYISPGRELHVIGVPQIPRSIARDVGPYMGMYALPLTGWDPLKREIWLKGMSSVSWLSAVKSPGATPETTSIYIQQNNIFDLYPQPQGQYVAFTRDANGSELFQLYLFDVSARTSILLSDGKSRNTEPVWSNTGDRIVYSSSTSGELGVDLRFVDPLHQSSDRLLAKSSGGYLKAYDWSPDNKQIIYCDFSANTVSTLWLLDVPTGRRSLLSPKSEHREFYDLPQFSKDGKGVYVVTDHDSDFRRLAYIDIASRAIQYVPSPSQSDVDEFALSPDGKLVAFTFNENGWSKIQLFDLLNARTREVTDVPKGIISDLKWRSTSDEVAFNLSSSLNPNDVYSFNLEKNKLELWARGTTSALNSSQFTVPENIHWTSFDKRSISGWLYRPPSTFKGKRPVIVDIHGGPEEEHRPGFLYDVNYYVNELGIARIYPNVRGSSGFGRNFLDLDDGMRREDAVKDIGALLDWIKTQPDLDADRVLVEGSSYGGNLALSTAFMYGDRIRGVISDSGITNLASFVEHTESWRRALQRAEFGDARNPKIKSFMERVAPVNNAKEITKPLLIFQGRNDPRVPVTEADRLVAATKGRVPVWYVLADNEGHGFTQPSNRDYQLYATILFVKEFLLN